MNHLAKLISLVALAAVILPSLLYLGSMINLEAVKWSAFFGTAVWFAATPLWMGRKLPLDAAEVEI